MNIYSDKEEYIPELKNVARMFVPFLDSDLKVSIKLCDGKIECAVNEKTYKFRFKQEISDGEKVNDGVKANDAKAFEKELLREYKIALYKTLKSFFNKKLPWGSLTGIRPTRIAYKLMDNGASLNSAVKVLKKKYLVGRAKADLVKRIIKEQQECYHAYDCNNYINLYVHIPFCPSRCAYCSFVSLDVNKWHGLLEPYLERLIEEIKLFKTDKKILSVYVGGGTPTVLSAEQLYRLLEQIASLSLDDNIEFTVEAGRPDTITAEKLAILKRFKVSRISVNPQTFCENTLKAIGRNHSLSDIFSAYELSRKFSFDINMDLIAGLNNETADDFAATVNKAIELRPENITVHALSIKNGSSFFNNNRMFNQSASKMTESAYKSLIRAGYSPYYLYRQKNMSDNLENIGYSLKGRQSVFNITSMEETVSVLAFGAGAITKIVTPASIERFANHRDVKLYIENFDVMHSKKLQFLNGIKP